MFLHYCFPGVYLKPTEEESRKFDEKVKWLENVMTRRRELYEAEEKTLRVMLAEEEEEKEKERRENERKTKGTHQLALCGSEREYNVSALFVSFSCCCRCF